ncbi:single-stranded-DNA-specific exonuclease RecJ [Albibacterium indicum]|uniref:single-stranded-DNA-specific exonuclease RecJ n=1 Tax=Albibacterium indicum TaxID=2292082 RepID=UPI000E503B6C|nr:single-stranded-DNA-specific exonuclease RecJ [Pedobacter indicus]
MQKRWVEKPQLYPEQVQNLSKTLNINPVLASLLVKREIHTYEDAKAFFCPDLGQLHDPYLMQDMEKAVFRITRALKNKEKILVYGDYDVDGTTAVAVVYCFLNELAPNYIDYYIPDRYEEGYGISKKGVDFAHTNQFSLIIALDCGIKANDLIDYGNQLGVDFIIADHHTPGARLPSAYAVLDPKRADCQYPFPELSGCGVGLKIVHALVLRLGLPLEEVYRYLDLVAVSISADMVPVVGENRILSFYGLKKLNDDPCPGLKALINLRGSQAELSSTDLIFHIGPRINAAGRIKHARAAVELLISQDPYLASSLSKEIEGQNHQRKAFDIQITEQATAMIMGSQEMMKRKTTVVFQPKWHKGVIGIVASRLIDKFYRPTIVLTQSNGLITGSARSIFGFDLYAALSQCSELFEQFGGHKYAAGLTMKKENVEALQERFEEVVAASIPDELLTPELLIDEQLHFDDVDGKFFRILNRFAPFGQENELPLFLSKNVMVRDIPQIVGKNHLKIRVSQGSSAIFDCIGFGLSHHNSLVTKGAAIDICYTIEENNWRGVKSVQLNIKDIRPAT